jgi:DNA-binding NarL/FixJ family response regulator
VKKEDQNKHKEDKLRLGLRDLQIADLLLQGCNNSEIAERLKMNPRTVKSRFKRLFLQFGIRGGIKRVKLATLLYRRQTCPENVSQNVFPVLVSSRSSNSWPKDSPTAK